MERDPSELFDDPEEDLDPFGDPDDIDVSIEEELDERLQAERD